MPMLARFCITRHVDAMVVFWRQIADEDVQFVGHILTDERIEIDIATRGDLREAAMGCRAERHGSIHR